MTKYAKATWLLNNLPDDINEFHISCGKDDDSQEDCYSLDDAGSMLLISTLRNGKHKVTLEVPSRGLEKYKNYWLSPNQVDDKDADDFGIE